MNHEFAFSRVDFGRVRQLILAFAGISLHERKENMVYNRLVRRLRATGTRDFSAYLDRVAAPGSTEREQFVNGDAHCRRASTVGPEGAGLPGAGSSVTRTPTTGRGTFGGLSVVIVMRPAASGTRVPAPTGSVAVSSQS